MLSTVNIAKHVLTYMMLKRYGSLTLLYVTYIYIFQSKKKQTLYGMWVYHKWITSSFCRILFSYILHREYPTAEKREREREKLKLEDNSNTQKIPLYHSNNDVNSNSIKEATCITDVALSMVYVAHVILFVFVLGSCFSEKLWYSTDGLTHITMHGMYSSLKWFDDNIYLGKTLYLYNTMKT